MKKGERGGGEKGRKNNRSELWGVLNESTYMKCPARLPKCCRGSGVLAKFEYGEFFGAKIGLFKINYVSSLLLF